MNKFILLVCIVILSAFNSSEAYTNVGSELNQQKHPVSDATLYAMCIIHHPLNSSKIRSMELVFPPDSEILTEKETEATIKVLTSKGGVTVLKNDTEVLNFMSKNGWEFKQAFSYTANAMNVIKYIFVKKST